MAKKKPTVKLKTIQFILDNKYNKIFNEMTTISKNIFNCCIFANNIFTIFKNKVFEEMYIFFTTVNNSELTETNKQYIIKLKNNTKIIASKFKVYYDIYTKNLELTKTNNNTIYEYIKNKITVNNIILNSSNIEQFYYDITNELTNKVNYDNDNKEYVFTAVIDRIIKSFYNKKYFLTKHQMLNHIKFTYYDEQLIADIKNNNYYYDNLVNINYKKKIENNFDVLLDSDQFIFKTFVYKYCLGTNSSKLPADIILNIIDKYYEAIKGYYGKLNKKMKANKPKYLAKTDKFNLFYYPSSYKRINNDVRLTVGKYIANNYNNYCKNSLNKFNDRKYYNNSNIVKSIKYRQNKKDYKKVSNGYIHKNYLIDATYLYLSLPKILNNKKIKLIQIKSYGHYFIAYISYEDNINTLIKDKPLTTLNKNDSVNIPTANNSISIDTGIKNLMTIYNPTGEQYIIKGSRMKSINEFYNKKIAKLKSINKKTLNIDKFNRLYSLLNERKNKINGEINKIVNKLTETYQNKKYFIVGYNEGWKTEVNLGNKTNRIFYEIPYARILTKLREKLESSGKQLIINEESYTSKCDSLSLENLGKNENYIGNRIYRGLFISNIGKAINADLNGAINIMRKVIELKQINGLKLFNPIRLVA